jgi:CUE domain
VNSKEQFLPTTRKSVTQKDIMNHSNIDPPPPHDDNEDADTTMDRNHNNNNIDSNIVVVENSQLSSTDGITVRPRRHRRIDGITTTTSSSQPTEPFHDIASHEMDSNVMTPPDTTATATNTTASNNTNRTTNNNNHHSNNNMSHTAWNVSRFYCWMSALGAVFAIIVAPTSTLYPSHTNVMMHHEKSSSTSSGSGSSGSSTATTITMTTSTVSSSTHLSTGSGGSNNNNNNNILSNALSSLTSTNNNIKSIHDPTHYNHNDPVCTSSSASSSSTTDSSGVTTTNGHHSNQNNVIAFAVTAGSSTAPERTKDAHDERWWFRWWSFPSSSSSVPKVLVPTAETFSKESRSQTNNNNLPSTTTTNDDPKDDPKHFWHSLLNIILMKRNENDTTLPPPHSTNKNRRVSHQSQSNHIASSSSLVSSILQVVLFSWLDPNLIFTNNMESSSHHNSNRNIPTNRNHNNNNANHNSHNTFPFDTIITNLIDKVLTSTLRLILIANWLIALTVLLHTAVAEYFLGNHPNTTGARPRRNSTRPNNTTNNNPATHNHPPNNHRTDIPNIPTAGLLISNSRAATSSASRERMGGYLLFKFLLISAMVAPDTFDLLILLSWYTVLSFLRSLASLCIQQIDTCRLLLHSVPQVGVLQLLCTVLCLDVMAAMTCIGLFHGAGYGMVLLLTCDCVLLAFDTISHIIQYYQSIMDVQHANHIQAIDDQQMTLHYQLLEQRRRQQEQQEIEQQQQSSLAVVVGTSATLTDTTSESGSPTATENDDDDDDDIEERSKDLDRQLDMFEQQHKRTTARIETMIFALQLMIDLLTLLHFIHIWTLHGIHFTFIDGVIALHLHSSATSALKKIHDRRATHRIAREMDELFHNATENDLQNAYIAGDVCCICLGTIHYFPTTKVTATTTTTTGSRNKDHPTQTQSRLPTCNVKKVACGHLYHTACLREVIERARSIEAARCPLCRAPFVPPKEQQQRQRNPTRVVERPRGNQITAAMNAPQRSAEPETVVLGDGANHLRQDETTMNINGVNANDGDGDPGINPVNVNAEDSIFRFSTEGLLPDWIPLPGFSFEIVRRPPPSSPTPTNVGVTMTADGTNVAETGEGQDQQPTARPNPQPPPAAAPAEQSVFRRIMLLAGIVQMSPQEEAVALEHLIDMFPQYDRQDLQRALRQRGTIDAVVESILLGVFVGIPHGGG